VARTRCGGKPRKQHYPFRSIYPDTAYAVSSHPRGPDPDAVNLGGGCLVRSGRGHTVFRPENLMKRTVLIICSALGLAATAAFLSATQPTATAAAVHGKPSSGQVERGRYLVAIGGCSDCHTPMKMGPNGPVPDFSLALSGHPAGAQLPPPPKLPEGPWFVVTAGLTAWSGPWGVTYSANLTPDIETGLGIWTEDMFRRAMKTGKHMGEGRPILPPMPVEAVKQFTDADLNAVFAYLKSIPAISNRVPEPLAPNGQPMFPE
jgi:hypothetical protein